MHKTKPTAVLVALTVLAGAPLAAQAQTAPSPTVSPAGIAARDDPHAAGPEARRRCPTTSPRLPRCRPTR